MKSLNAISLLLALIGLFIGLKKIESHLNKEENEDILVNEFEQEKDFEEGVFYNYIYSNGRMIEIWPGNCGTTSGTIDLPTEEELMKLKTISERLK